MLETVDLILDKASFSDWKEIYRNVWSREESAKYMWWDVTATEAAAKIRIQKTIAWQESHDAWFVYEKPAKKPVGFAGIERLSPRVCQEAGICLGPDYTGRGYGTQILKRLIEYAREELGAKEFLCSARRENEASKRLIRSLGFAPAGTSEKTDERNGQAYVIERYRLLL